MKTGNEIAFEILQELKPGEKMNKEKSVRTHCKRGHIVNEKTVGRRPPPKSGYSGGTYCKLCAAESYRRRHPREEAA